MGRFLLAGEGPPCLLRIPSQCWAPVGGVVQKCGSLVQWGNSRDAAAAPTISHTQSPADSEDAQGWRRARVAVPSGSSFPRNPLGSTLGIPGNTVLGAMAQRLETAHPAGSHSLQKSRQPRYGPAGGIVSGSLHGEVGNPARAAPCWGATDAPVGHCSPQEDVAGGRGPCMPLLPCVCHPATLGSIKVSTPK